MSYEHPALFLEHKDVGGLDHGVVKAIGKGGGDVFGAGYPADAPFDAHPDGAEGDADALGIGENSGPASADFIPAE